ncbi:MAG TPA: hypothetical protein DDY32_18420, partial [Desulfobulbaceae bacterium]|nr:hypothetical protein [Desulfobulbaceae bacterium]
MIRRRCWILLAPSGSFWWVRTVGPFLVYSTEDGQTKLEVRLETETVWLTQQHMAELFQTTQQNISLHLNNIYEEGELSREATYKEFLSVRQEGMRSVQRRVACYNLDAIISVGYRIKSAVATRFRIWATQQFAPTHRQGFRSRRRPVEKSGSTLQLSRPSSA